VLAVCVMATCTAAGADDSWTVVCNTDCEGVNTCMQKQLCVGEEVETGACIDNPACAQEDDRCPPVPCAWGEWEEWQNDGISGLCQRSRSFTPNRCGGSPCIGTVSDTIYCDPVKRLSLVRDCVFAQWGDWTNCDPETLQRSRDRPIAVEAAYGGRSCVGPLTQTEPCGERLEPVDCEMGDWMAWSGCSHTCGGGQHHRMRAIRQKALRGGKLCGDGLTGEEGFLHLTAACNQQQCVDDHAPQDCILEPWEAWSKCFEQERQMYRERKVLQPGGWGGRTCSGELKEVKPCSVKDPNATKPVNCKLSEWDAWTLCTRTCEGGQTSRQRHIEVPSQNGGQACHDTTSETTACNEFPCAMDPESRDCSLAMWSQWTGCSAQCGQGIQERSRGVRVSAMPGGLGCSDPLEEVRACEDVLPCEHVDCSWGLWSHWSGCSRSCSGGFKKRSREVEQQPSRGGKSCEAFENISEVEGCNTEPCYEQCVDGMWSSWEEWSTCSRSCAGGVRWRNRQVARQATPCGIAAVGEASDEEQCSMLPCEGDQDCQLSEWEQWQPCSRSCDGVTSRTRKILQMNKGAGEWCSDVEGENVPLEQVQACNGAKDIMAMVESAEPGATAAMQECGFAGHEPIDCELGEWEVWSDCSASCDGGQQSRKRKIVALPENGGKACDGPLELIAPCAALTCVAPEDCVWGSWSNWGSCSQCDGDRNRVRQVARQGNSKGKLCESGTSKQVEKCNNCSPYKTLYCVWDTWIAGDCSVSCGTGGWRKKVRMLAGTEDLPAGGLAATVGHVKGPNARCDGSEVDFTKCEDMPVCDATCTAHNCQFSDWSDWSEEGECQGLCKRHRKVGMNASCGGKACAGDLAQTKECPSETCKATRPCKMSEWGSWTPCEPGLVQRTRHRAIDVTAGPQGMACNASLTETSSCDEAAGTVADCQFTEWGSWSACSASCGDGSSERTRQILTHAIAGGKACMGPLQLTRTCRSSSCGEESVDCVVSDWEAWSGCDSKHQVATRKRSITMPKGSGKPCNGTLMESGPCINPKAVDCVWADWAPWGNCGKACGGGQRFQTREVLIPAEHGGKPCEGELGVTESCNTMPCSDKDCQVSEWQMWSVCQTNCGQGQQTRKRSIFRAAQVGGAGCLSGLEEARGCVQEGGPCIGDKDCVWAMWSKWSDCFQAEFCGIGYRRRKRGIEVAPEGVGKPCMPVATEEVRAFASCPGSCDSRSCVDGKWGDWDDWSGCSVTCGEGGLRSRTRGLVQEANDCGQPAEGKNIDYAPCSAPSCSLSSPLKTDCIFGAWSGWMPSECPATCNGQQQRTRTIVRYSSNGGEPCAGATSEATRCNPLPGQADPAGCESGAPVDCVLQDWSRWSECSAQCGTGHRARRRAIAQEPKFSGQPCENPLEELQECNASKPCVDWSMDCKWADWEEWGGCRALTGQQTRSRRVLQLKVGFGEDCHGAESEVADCERTCEEKPYICDWAAWSLWSQCTLKCGPEGRRTRIRQLQLGGEASLQAIEAPAVSQGAAINLNAVNQNMTIQRFSAATERLASVTERRHRDLGFSFAGGLASFLVVFGIAQVAQKRWQSGRRLTAHQRTNFQADLSTRLQSEQL